MIPNLIPQERFRNWGAMPPHEIIFGESLISVHWTEDAQGNKIQQLMLYIDAECCYSQGEFLNSDSGVSLQFSLYARVRGMWVIRSQSSAYIADENPDLISNFFTCENSDDKCAPPNEPGDLSFADFSMAIDNWVSNADVVQGSKSDFALFDFDWEGCSLSGPCPEPGYFIIAPQSPQPYKVGFTDPGDQGDLCFGPQRYQMLIGLLTIYDLDFNLSRYEIRHGPFDLHDCETVDLVEVDDEGNTLATLGQASVYHCPFTCPAGTSYDPVVGACVPSRDPEDGDLNYGGYSWKLYTKVEMVSNLENYTWQGYPLFTEVTASATFTHIRRKNSSNPLPDDDPSYMEVDYEYLALYGIPIAESTDIPPPIPSYRVDSFLDDGSIADSPNFTIEGGRCEALSRDTAGAFGVYPFAFWHNDYQMYLDGYPYPTYNGEFGTTPCEDGNGLAVFSDNYSYAGIYAVLFGYDNDGGYTVLSEQQLWNPQKPNADELQPGPCTLCIVMSFSLAVSIPVRVVRTLPDGKVTDLYNGELPILQTPDIPLPRICVSAPNGISPLLLSVVSAAGQEALDFAVDAAVDGIIAYFSLGWLTAAAAFTDVQTNFNVEYNCE